MLTNAVPRQLLSNLLRRMSQVIPASSPKEVLTKIKVVFTDSEIQLHGTDLAQYLKVSAPCVVSDPGIALLAYADLRDIIAKMSGGAVELILNGDTVSISDERASFELQTHNNIDEFPGACDFHCVQTTTIDSDELCRCLTSVIHCIDKEATRFALNAVHIEGCGDNGVLRFTTTDGRRITWTETAAQCGVFTSLLPSQAAKAITQIIDEKFPCQIRIGESWFGIEAENLSFSCRQIDGRFPSTIKFRDMIKSDYYYSDASLAELKVIASQAAIVSVEESMGVNLDFTGDEIVVTHHSTKAKYKAKTQCQHPAAKVTVNSQFLQHALSNCKSIAIASNSTTLSIIRDSSCYEIIQGITS